MSCGRYIYIIYIFAELCVIYVCVGGWMGGWVDECVLFYFACANKI